MTIYAQHSLRRKPSMRRHRASRRSRAVEMLEFALLLPISLFMLIFMIDMGIVILNDAVLHDASFVVARSAAQVGYISTGQAQASASEAMCALPGYNASNSLNNTIGLSQIGQAPLSTNTVTFDGINCSTNVGSPGAPPASGKVVYCAASAASLPASTNTAIDEVQVTLNYKVPLVPGLNLILHHINSNVNNGYWPLQAKGIALCEIVR